MQLAGVCAKASELLQGDAAAAGKRCRQMASALYGNSVHLHPLVGLSGHAPADEGCRGRSAGSGGGATSGAAGATGGAGSATGDAAGGTAGAPNGGGGTGMAVFPGVGPDASEESEER
eukprot:scaffold90077_cov57-Phaeocystis_antarctica.AAC.3